MKRYYIIYLLILIVSVNVGFSQTPINDLNWTLNFEDNFDGPTLDVIKWDYRPSWKSTCLDTATATDPNNGGTNHVFSNGTLKLISKEEESTCETYSWPVRTDENGNPVYDENGNPVYDEIITESNMHYTSGQIISKQNFKYGYFEIYCKIPYMLPISFPLFQTGDGLSPTFWLWPQDVNEYYNSNVIWSEIDIFEIDAKNNKNTFNVHYEDNIIDNNDPTLPTWSLWQQDTLLNYYYYLPIDFSSFRKFGCEWTPNYISFYIDDILIYTTEVRYLFNNTWNQYTDRLLRMNIWAGIATAANNFQKEITSRTLLPYEFEIDYIRVYELKIDCNNDFYSSYGYSNFDNKVKRHIELSSPIPMWQNFSFRATQSIDLENGFEVPLGSSVYINNSDCENN